MKYEHTISAIVFLVIGALIIIDFFMMTFANIQWIPSGNSILVNFLKEFNNLGFFKIIIGFVLITFGIIWIRRELWVRKFERQARG